MCWPELVPQMVEPEVLPWDDAVNVASKQFVLRVSAMVVTGPAMTKSSKSSLI